MVPGVSHKGGGVQLPGVVHGVPVHALLDCDGYRGCHQRQRRGHGQLGVVPAYELLDAGPADAQPGQGQDQSQHQRRYALKALMPIRVPGVGAALGKLHPDESDQRCKNV